MTGRSEWARIDLLRAVLGGAEGAHVLCGIGDDAAIVAPGRPGAVGEALVWTVDSAVEGVHFRRDLLSFEDLGYRATMAAASDLAAMGAAPLGLLAALVLPADVDDADLGAIAAGQRAACDALGTAIVGGNLARGGELSITTTALGSAPAPLRRDGARPGDVIALAGPVGLSAAGLSLLQRHDVPPGAPAEHAVAAFRRPLAHIAAGLRARGVGRAAIDISDGLAADLGHLARASNVRVLLDAEALVSRELAEVAALLGVDALELSLYGGEDYALAVAGPEAGALPGFVAIGRCAPREERAGEVALVGRDGKLTSIAARGYDHFA